jgi:hypothetical protein
VGWLAGGVGGFRWLAAVCQQLHSMLSLAALVCCHVAVFVAVNISHPWMYCLPALQVQHSGGHNQDGGGQQVRPRKWVVE